MISSILNKNYYGYYSLSSNRPTGTRRAKLFVGAGVTKLPIISFKPADFWISLLFGVLKIFSFPPIVIVAPESLRIGVNTEPGVDDPL